MELGNQDYGRALKLLYQAVKKESLILSILTRIDTKRLFARQRFITPFIVPRVRGQVMVEEAGQQPVQMQRGVLALKDAM